MHSLFSSSLFYVRKATRFSIRVIKKIPAKAVPPLVILSLLAPAFQAGLFTVTPRTANAAAETARQEINITDAYLSSASGQHATSSAIISIDTTVYAGATYYFEAVASTSASLAAEIYLKNATTFATVATISIPTNTTTYTRLRSSSFTPTAGAADYVVVMGNEAIHKGAIATRVVIIQTSLSNTQTQIEIGNDERGKTNTATAALTQPKYWYYDSTKWDGNVTFFAEVTYKASPVASSTTYDVSATTTTTQYNYVGSSNVGSVVVEAWGPGGGGDGVTSASTIGGGGGGGGAYARATTTTVTAGSTNRVHVGRGGAEGVSTTASSTFIGADGTIIVRAAGGVGADSATGAAGGVATSPSTIGTVVYAGGAGGNGNTDSDVGGGGGGAAGQDGAGVTASNAASTVPSAGGRGDNNLGGVGGAEGTGSNDTCANSNGRAGYNNALGGGGGGGSDGDGGTTCTGGNGGLPGGGGGGSDEGSADHLGGPGRIIITEHIGSVGIALEEDNGSFGGWTFKAQIVTGGQSASSVRVRTSAFTPTTGRNYRLVASTTASAASYDIYNAKIIVNQVSVGKWYDWYDDWYDASYPYRVKLTVDYTKVPATATDFPVYVDLANLPAEFHTNVTASAGDIRVTTADGRTEVPREVVTYNAATDSGELHFKAPSLSSSANTVFYIYYGNANASDYATTATYGAQAVWDGNYKGVWHLKDGTTLTATDSTSNANNGTITGPTAATGKVDGGGSFNGTTDVVDNGTNSSLANIFSSGGTAEAWIYPTSDGEGNLGRYFDKWPSSGDTAGWRFLMCGSSDSVNCTSSRRLLFSHGFSSTRGEFRSAASSISLNAWQHVVVTYNSSSASNVPIFYINGSVSTLSTLDSPSGTAGDDSARNLYIGNRSAADRTFDGTLDELRVSATARSANWITTEYNNQSSPSTFYTVGSEETSGSNPAWPYRVKLTVDYTKVPATATDFPVYVDLANLPADFHANVTASAGDIRITTADGRTEVPREVVTYSAAGDTGELHFKAPSLSSTANTVFYIYYGNAGAADYATTATYGAQAVWDSNYKGVWHLKDGTTLTATDSTSNANNGTITGSTAATGKVDGGGNFDNIDDAINLGQQSSLNLSASDLTLSAWIKNTSPGVRIENVITKAGGTTVNKDYSFSTDANGKITGHIFEGGTGVAACTGTTVLSATSLYYATYSYSGGFSKCYLDGALEYTSTQFTGSRGGGTPIDAYIGSRDPSGTVEPFPGIIDEVRISNIARSANWITTEYNNQSSPSTFYAVGSEETSGSNPAWPYRVKLTVDYTKVPATATDFPVYVDLANLPAAFHTNVTASAGDIRITTADGRTEVPREVVTYSAAADTGELHFKAPSLSSTANTVFYIYYGNANAADYAVTATYGAQAVWDSNYKAVWHMGDNAANTTVVQSTSNSNTGVAAANTSGKTTTGKVGGALTFNGSSDVVDYPNNIAFDSSDFTLSGWINMTGAAGGADRYNFIFGQRVDTIGNGSPVSNMWINVSNVPSFSVRDNVGAMVTVADSTNRSTATWYYMVGVKTSSNIALYVNGSAITPVSHSLSGDFDAGAIYRKLGAQAYSGSTQSWTNGKLDEVRVSTNIARSADWITTEYNNQSSPSTFYAVGTEETPVSITKFEAQYLLANTGLASGTSLQKFLSSWSTSEWTTTNAYILEVSAADDSTSVVELDTAGGTQVANSVVTSPDNRGRSSSMCMPANGDLDIKATTNGGNVYSVRIIVQIGGTAASCGFTLTHYRWRQDDGTETSASYPVAEDAALTSGKYFGDRVRLRMLIESAGASTPQFKLEHASSSCTVWVTVPAIPILEHWMTATTQYVSDGAATTDSAGLTNVGGKTFTAGQVRTNSNTTGAITLSSSLFTEIEYAIQSTSNVDVTNSYCFRVVDATGGSFIYTVTPSITIFPKSRKPALGGINVESSGTGSQQQGGGVGGGSGSEGSGSGGQQSGGGGGGGGNSE